jgi:peptide/nickel transport system substrate-binding protein
MKYTHFVIAALAGCLLLLFSSCGNPEKKKSVNVIGGKLYGGECKFMSSEKVQNFFPVSSVDIYAKRLNAQLFEPLLKLNITTMEVEPSLATSYTISDDAMRYTFRIREGVFFHDDACFQGKPRKVTAKDVKYSLEFACSGLPLNKMSYLLVNRIKGAQTFFSKTKHHLDKSGVAGIKVLDAQTLEIQLTEPFIGFEKVLSHTNLGIFPKEAFEKYGEKIRLHPVGTGPFKLQSMDENGVTLTKNTSYWRKDEFGNKLPFLDKVTMVYAKDKKSELLAFRKGEIDLVLEIPVENIENILGSLRDAQQGKNIKHKVESTSSLNMNYIAFACESETFKNPLIRKAFNLAIDRNEIVNKWLLGEGWPAEKGFVPVMVDYPSEQLRGHTFSVQTAQSYLKKAGYPKGNGFPVLDFYVNAKEGSKAHTMAIGVVDQLKQNLGVDLRIKLCTLDEREEAIYSGKAQIWRTGWVADYPDPENFLSLYYGENSATNALGGYHFQCKSKEYDAIFERALKESNQEKRYSLLAECDQLLIDQAAILPLFTDDFMVMVNVRIRDFKTNAMENLDFSEIYIKKPRP